MGRLGVDWSSLAQAIGRERRKGQGRQRGVASDLGTECAQRSSPVLSSHCWAATLPGTSAHLLTLWTCTGEISGHEL